ncbi:unnamed protein product [Heligmosomoides polygyrus]|uniref:Uncharacterized protein n=1 Tax=Heligmosomoides polygyrus TaxID=6339 RepID=A0A183FPZ5_HELPZ|nr:unnamed protein product [Heligmosomoides polygyrus]
MVKGKLYGDKDNFRTQKVLIAAKLGNVELQLAGDAPPADKFPLGVVRFRGSSECLHVFLILVIFLDCEAFIKWLCSG